MNIIALNLAKVGVEGSNPFARSKFPDKTTMRSRVRAALVRAGAVAFMPHFVGCASAFAGFPLAFVMRCASCVIRYLIQTREDP